MKLIAICEQAVAAPPKELLDKAQAASKKHMCVQHVNKTASGSYAIDDFYDADNTVASFENGKRLHESEIFEEVSLKSVKPPGKMGDYVFTAQAAKILGVAAATVRQLVLDGVLESLPPEPGKREHMFLSSVVYAYKDARDKRKETGEGMGRPKGS